MESFFSLSGVVIILWWIASMVRASAPIATAIITERAKTARMKMELESSVDEGGTVKASQKTISAPSTGISRSTPTSNRLGLLSVAVSLCNLAFLQFSLVNSAALTVGSAASIAQAFGLFIMGVLLLLWK